MTAHLLYIQSEELSYYSVPWIILNIFADTPRKYKIGITEP